MLNDVNLGCQSSWGLLDRETQELMKVERVRSHDGDDGYQLVKPSYAEENATVYLVTEEASIIRTLMRYASPARSSMKVPLYQPDRPMWKGVDLVPVRVTLNATVDMQPQLRPLEFRRIETRAVPYKIARNYVPDIEKRDRYLLLIVHEDLLKNTGAYAMDQHMIPYCILGRAPVPDEYMDLVKGVGTLLLVEEGYPT